MDAPETLEIAAAAVRDAVTYADQWLAYRREARDIPGLVAAVRRDQDTLLLKGYGCAQLEPAVAIAPSHIFRVASHSKMFTATAVMQLVEQGRLRLDDRIVTHLPWLTAAADVTLRQLLNHAAGLIRDGVDADYWLTEAAFPDRAQLQTIATDGVIFNPNQRFKYSNIGYSLLGLAIEAVTGRAYNDYVREHIVDRLGLPDTGPDVFRAATISTGSDVFRAATISTGSDVSDTLRDRLVTGYTTSRFGVARRAVPLIDTRALSPATGFYSTAADLCRFAAAHWLGDTTLLSDASKREMQQSYRAVEDADEHYGLGFNARTIGERLVFGHGGGFPGQSTRTLFDPADRLIVVVLSNTAGQRGAAGPIAEAIVKIIDFALGAARDDRDQVAPSWPVEQFVGRFANLWGVTDVAAFGQTLVATSPELDDPVQYATRLKVLDQDTLRIAKTSGYGSPGETIHYERDPAGTITRIVAGGMSSYPVEVFRARYT